MICPKCKKNVELAAHTPAACCWLRWDDICPQLYHGTKLDFLPAQSATAEAITWRPEHGRGLLLTGPTGTGKTRTAFAILQQLHMKGEKIAVLDCVTFAHECAARFSDGRGEAWVNGLSKIQILFLDDFDKAKFTERVEAELFGIIERRIANCLPIVITTQKVGDGIVSKFSDRSRGEAVVRRLREFCQVVIFQ